MGRKEREEDLGLNPARERKWWRNGHVQRTEKQLPGRGEGASRVGSGQEEESRQDSGWIRGVGAVERSCPVRPRAARQGPYSFIRRVSSESVSATPVLLGAAVSCTGVRSGLLTPSASSSARGKTLPIRRGTVEPTAWQTGRKPGEAIACLIEEATQGVAVK